MKFPKDTMYIGIDCIQRIIFYKVINNTWFYISKDNLSEISEWIQCLNKPTIPLMKVNI